MTLKPDASDRQVAVLITGAAGAIGQAITLACIRKGWFVFANVRTHSSGQQLQHALCLQETGAQDCCQPLVYDISQQDDVKAAFNTIRKSGKQLRALVNNAGIMQDAAISMTAMADFNQAMIVNVSAAFQHLQLASRLMTRQRCGSIINMSSLVAVDGSAGQVAYSASKAALIGMTKSAAKELAPLGITVNAIAPGFIDTKLTSAYQAEKRAALIANIPLGREGTPQDVSALVLHLISTEAAYITGQTIKVDGMMQLK